MLTQKAFNVLYLLIKNAGQLVKKETLISEIWHDSFVEDANITQQIYLLRKILGNDKTGNALIKTVPKRGYCFIGEVKIIEEFAIKKSDEIDLSIQSENSINSIKSSSSKVNPNKIILFGAAAISVLIIFVSVFIYVNKKSVSDANNINSIAVLPFKKIGTENDDSKLGFGLADAVINNLSKQQKIPVRSMSAVFDYANQANVDPVKAGKQLDVDSVLEGTVQQEGEQVRVSLRLIKTTDGSTIWAETFNEKFSNIFALQDSISDKVAQSISVNLSGWEGPLITKQPSNPEAYRFYQMGVYFSNIKTNESLERAVQYFQKAIELDSEYAPSHAMLADTYNWLNQFGADSVDKNYLEKSELEAKKSLELDDSLAEGHISYSYILFVKYKDYDAAQKSLELAVKLSPFNPFARLHYGWELLQRGDLESGYQQIKLSQEYAPLSAHNNLTLCNVLIYKREYEQAMTYCQKSLEIQPNTPFVNIQRANILYLLGKTDEAINLLELENQDKSLKEEAQGSIAYILAKTGKTAEAEKIYVQIKASKDSSYKFANLALIGFTLGKTEDISMNLEKMVATSAIPPFFLIFDPFWEEMLKNPEYRKIISYQ